MRLKKSDRLLVDFMSQDRPILESVSAWSDKELRSILMALFDFGSAGVCWLDVEFLSDCDRDQMDALIADQVNNGRLADYMASLFDVSVEDLDCVLESGGK
jgi:hypothetical protein